MLNIYFCALNSYTIRHLSFGGVLLSATEYDEKKKKKKKQWTTIGTDENNMMSAHADNEQHLAIQAATMDFIFFIQFIDVHTFEWLIIYFSGFLFIFPFNLIPPTKFSLTMEMCGCLKIVMRWKSRQFIKINKIPRNVVIPLFSSSAKHCMTDLCPFPSLKTYAKHKNVSWK